jgi:hypothetical protein
MCMYIPIFMYTHICLLYNTVYSTNCADKGYGASCFNLAKLFLSGKGVDQSDTKAEGFFKQVYICIHIYIYIYIYVCIYIYIYIYVYIRIYAYICIHIYTCTCIYIYTYIYIDVKACTSGHLAGCYHQALLLCLDHDEIRCVL